MTDFDAMYKQDDDPWSVRHSWYERRKRAVLMASLPSARFGKVLELGCGIGEMTYLLSSVGAHVMAVDASETAAAICRRRVGRAGANNVSVQVLQLPASWPLGSDDSFDLVVVSELAYYFSEPELASFIEQCMASLALQGIWVMCHYKPQFHDRIGSTDEIHNKVNALSELQRIVSHDDEQFRLDIWRHATGARS
ncbi:class I SAM-dependent methyltransferase [Pusillimonas sp. ANT_WB101]|uniref:class I SAM-dependent methyltransferase n=1 Tax=Pusillimonas sp. ANT_WB101 TaxID=2597356 RepID=UPI0011EBB9F8|nr:class I SAM-dependent methyltransferase [Pusillimonas sp. ANT_WB101]KAA0890805.1 class I SAM-dependent methyltransferase [Pusillimonas sp. ANT_WB101]